jgi:hypothetical protein
VDLKEIGWEVVGLMNVAQDRDKWWSIVNMVMNFIYSIAVHGELFTLKQQTNKCTMTQHALLYIKIHLHISSTFANVYRVLYKNTDKIQHLPKFVQLVNVCVRAPVLLSSGRMIDEC